MEEEEEREGGGSFRGMVGEVLILGGRGFSGKSVDSMRAGAERDRILLGHFFFLAHVINFTIKEKQEKFYC